MAKFMIAQNPTFKKDVDIPRVNGTINKVPFEFKYRDRMQLAELFAGWQQAAKDLQAQFADRDDVTLVDVTKADIDRQIDQVSDLVVGWGFGDKMDADSIRALVETSAGAGDAIVTAYQSAFASVRLGN